MDRKFGLCGYFLDYILDFSKSEKETKMLEITWCIHKMKSVINLIFFFKCLYTENVSFLFCQVTILLRMDDKMNRQLSCELTDDDTSSVLAEELVHYGFINEVSSICHVLRSRS